VGAYPEAIDGHGRPGDTRPGAHRVGARRYGVAYRDAVTHQHSPEPAHSIGFRLTRELSHRLSHGRTPGLRRHLQSDSRAFRPGRRHHANAEGRRHRSLRTRGRM
jgi:hypothetical protein